MSKTESKVKLESCPVCQSKIDDSSPENLGKVRGNTERFKNTEFNIWKCPNCRTLLAIDPVDFDDIYSDYPLNERKLDAFAKGTFSNLLARLKKVGVKKTDYILDYGSGRGLFVEYLKQKGYMNSFSYDPYCLGFKELPISQGGFDVVINNDVLEHCEDIHKVINHNFELLKEGGVLYIGTPESDPVNIKNLEPEIMRLHQPFHRIILTEKSLHEVVLNYNVSLVASYKRSYHDTLRPFSNYRFLDELNKALGHNLDLAMDESITTRTFLLNPQLWFFAIFGYFFPSAYEPAVIVRKSISKPT